MNPQKLRAIKSAAYLIAVAVVVIAELALCIYSGALGRAAIEGIAPGTVIPKGLDWFIGVIMLGIANGAAYGILSEGLKWRRWGGSNV